MKVQGVTAKVHVQVIGVLLDVVQSLKYVCSCFSEDGDEK